MPRGSFDRNVLKELVMLLLLIIIIKMANNWLRHHSQTLDIEFRYTECLYTIGGHYECLDKESTLWTNECLIV